MTGVQTCALPICFPVTIGFPVAFMGLMGNFFRYVDCASMYKAPDFVIVIIVSQTIVFFSFGLVQIYRFWRVSAKEADEAMQEVMKKAGEGGYPAPDERNKVYEKMAREAMNVEWAYIMLSLIGKTVLSISIFAGNMK